MRMKKRFLTMLVLLVAVVTGAWAQTETLLTTITPTAKEQASYSTANVATVSFSYTAGGSSAYIANWGWWGYGWSATVNAVEGYTITKCVFYDDQNRTATDSEAPFVVETTEEDKTPRVNGTPIKADTSKGIKKIEVYGYVTPTASTYSVTLAEGTEDGDKWTISPTEAAEGATVTATYSGEKRVKSVKAVKKDAAPAAVTPATVTVTWNNDDITGSGKSFTKDGVTITAGDIDFNEKNFMGGGTFTTTLGNFTKIEVTAGDVDHFSGTGWSGNYTKKTWTGTPASSVPFSGDINGNGQGNAKFVFTIEP